MSYIKRSSTEFYLSGNHRPELYLTKVNLSSASSSSSSSPSSEFSSVSSIDEDILRPLENYKTRCAKANLFHTENLTHSCKNNKLNILKPTDIEEKIESFIHDFKKSGMGSLLVNKNLKENEKADKTKSFKNKNRLSGQKGDLEKRVSWLSTDSSTPSAPLHSITSPSDHNFISSSLASSILSQGIDDIDNLWKFSFHADYNNLLELPSPHHKTFPTHLSTEQPTKALKKLGSLIALNDQPLKCCHCTFILLSTLS